MSERLGARKQGRANAGAASAAPPTRPGLPRALTICRLLHQPPVLAEVICGFAQEAANRVILRGQGGRFSCVPALSLSTEEGGARLRLGPLGPQGAQALSPCLATHCPQGKDAGLSEDSLDWQPQRAQKNIPQPLPPAHLTIRLAPSSPALWASVHSSPNAFATTQSKDDNDDRDDNNSDTDGAFTLGHVARSHLSHLQSDPNTEEVLLSFPCQRGRSGGTQMVSNPRKDP